MGLFGNGLIGGMDGIYSGGLGTQQSASSRGLITQHQALAQQQAQDIFSQQNNSLIIINGLQLKIQELEKEIKELKEKIVVEEEEFEEEYEPISRFHIMDFEKD